MNFNPLEAFWALLSHILEPFINFLLSFLPNGDAAIYGVIDAIGTVGGYSTFNVYYFCDWSAVLICLGVLITVILIVQIVKLIFRSITLADMAIEAVPIYE